MTSHESDGSRDASTQTEPTVHRGLLQVALTIPVVPPMTQAPPASTATSFYTAYPSEFVSCDSPRPPSSLGDLNPDDGKDMLEEDHNQQEWGEDPRTSRATVFLKNMSRVGRPNQHGQYQGEDLRTSKVSRNKVGSKQEWAGDPRTPRSGEETKDSKKMV